MYGCRTCPNDSDPNGRATPTATVEPTMTPKPPLPTPYSNHTVAPRWDSHPAGTRTGKRRRRPGAGGS